MWTDSKTKTFIVGVLRAGARRWPPKYETLKEAYVGKKKNKKTNRVGSHYVCNLCKEEYPASEVNVDHIAPVVDPVEGFIDWNTFIERLFCSKDNLQVLCTECHTHIKTKGEKEEAALWNSIRKQFPREESTYRNMISRCYNPKATGYEFYGGRGITVCDEWKESFFSFYGDMGDRPEGTTLDRVDVNGNYNKENCRWAYPIEQARNTTANNFIEYNNEIKCLQDWGEVLNIKPNTILTRLRRGWTIEEAFEKKKRSKEYNGRLSVEDIEELVSAINSGISQSEYARKIGMDSSQVNRIYHKFKNTRREEDKC